MAYGGYSTKDIEDWLDTGIKAVEQENTAEQQRKPQPRKYRIQDKYLITFYSKWIPGPEPAAPLSIQRALVNPTSFTESVKAEYSKRPVLGLSHEVLQYIRTTARTITMQLWVSYHLYVQRKWGGADRQAVLRFRNFFESLIVPTGLGLAPPYVYVDWPGAELHFKGVLESLDIEYQRFAFDGTPMELSLSVTFCEIADDLMTSESVMENGLGMPSYGAPDFSFKGK
jgi:hypothetical protein